MSRRESNGNPYSLEALEPRVLLSADWLPATDGAGLFDTEPVGAAPASAVERPAESGPGDEDDRDAHDRRLDVRREIVFIDHGVENAEQLLRDILARDDDTRDFEVRFLADDRDGLEQIGEALTGSTGIDAVHVISHGSASGLRLGATWLDLGRLDDLTHVVAGWRAALSSGADILLYGCNLAATAAGRALVEALAGLTGADVAASSDRTGAASRGGDWVLEFATGGIESEVAPSAAAQARWLGLLDYFQRAEGFTSPVAGSWQTIDLSGAPYNVPANAVVEIALANTDASAPRFGGVRTFGSSIDRRIDLENPQLGGGGETVVMHVQTDASSRIEVYAEDAVQVTFTLLGYWDTGTFVERFDLFTVASDGAWLDQSLSAWGVGPGDIAEIAFMNHNAVSPTEAGVRAKGSTLERRMTTHGIGFDGGNSADSMLVQADGTASATIQAYAGNASHIDFRLTGYWSVAPDTYTEAATDIGSPTASATWQVKDLSTAGVPPNAIVDLLASSFTTAEMFTGFREVGSTDSRLVEVLGTIGAASSARMHAKADAVPSIEWYFEDITETNTFLVLGYWGGNFAPTIALPGGGLSYTEGDGAVVIDSGATVSDPDSADFDTGTLTIEFTAGGTANDRLAIRDQGAGVGNISVSGSTVRYDFGAGPVAIGTFSGGTDGATPLVVTLNAAADQTATQALLRNITYANVSATPSTANRTVRVVLTDGDGGTSPAQTETIIVSIGNVAPTVTLPGGGLAYTEGDGAVVIDSGATASDPDSADFDTGTLTIEFTAGGTANDRLAIRDQGAGVGNISVSGSTVRYDFGAGPVAIGTFSGGTDGATPLVVTLNASADVTATQALLRNITYENVSDDPSTAGRTVRATLTDGDGGTSNQPTMAVTLTAQNDDPSISLPGGAVNYGALDPPRVIDTGATVSDPDSADFDTGTLTVDFTANGTANDRLAIRDQGAGVGNISVAGSTVRYDFGAGPVAIGTFSGGTDGATPLVATLNAAADQTATQALLRNITYANVSATPSTANRTVRVVLTDGDGGASPAQTETIIVSATPANTAPSIVDQSFSLDDGAAPGTLVGRVGATDPDTGDTLSFAIIGGNTGGAFLIDPSSGELTVNAAPSMETSPVVVLSVEVTDSGGLSAQATVTISLVAASDPEGPGGDPEPPPDSPPDDGQDETDPVDDGDDASDDDGDVAPPAPDPPPEDEDDDVVDNDLPEDVDEPPPPEIDLLPELDRTEPDEEEEVTQSSESGTRTVVRRIRRPEVTDVVELTRLEDSSEFWQDLDAMSEEISESVERSQAELVVGAVKVTAVLVTVGFVTFILRAGAVMASLLSSLPVWLRFDPLPILALSKSDYEKRKRELTSAEKLDRLEMGSLGETLEDTRWE